jgi:hypothetical protein
MARLGRRRSAFCSPGKLAVAPLLLQTGRLDTVLLGAPLKRVEPRAGSVSISLMTAIFLIVAWAVLPLVAGAWRTQPATREPPPAERTDMREQKSAIPRRGLLAILALALRSNPDGVRGRTCVKREKISKTATTYLRALADGDTAKACAQLTDRARGGRCEAAMKERLSGLQPTALKNAADDSIDIDVHGNTATAGLSEPEGAHFLLIRVRDEWRIDSGYTLG